MRILNHYIYIENVEKLFYVLGSEMESKFDGLVGLFKELL